MMQKYIKNLNKTSISSPKFKQKTPYKVKK